MKELLKKTLENLKEAKTSIELIRPRKTPQNPSGLVASISSLGIMSS